jgi:hypothetical protein
MALAVPINGTERIPNHVRLASFLQGRTARRLTARWSRRLWAWHQPDNPRLPMFADNRSGGIHQEFATGILTDEMFNRPTS